MTDRHVRSQLNLLALQSSDLKVVRELAWQALEEGYVEQADYREVIKILDERQAIMDRQRPAKSKLQRFREWLLKAR